MNRGEHTLTTSDNYREVRTQRHYMQYVLETVWTAAAGAAGGHWLS